MTEGRTCAWCGVDISHRDPRALTCSKQCKGKRDNELNPSYIRKPPTSCLCKVCGEPFLHHNPRARLCAAQCKAKERHLASRRAAKERKNERKSNPVKKFCDWCGSPFTVERARGVVYRQTCSDACWLEHNKARHRGWQRRRITARALGNLIIERAQHDPE